MPNVFGERDETQIIGGGYGGGFGGGGFGGGGFSGCFAMIILLVVLLWLLFRGSKDGLDGNCNNYGGAYAMPYPYPPYAPNYGGGNCCSPLDCKIPMAPDMSNCEVDKDIWKIDAHMEKCCCETQKTILEDGSKTREVLYADKVEALRDKLAEAYSEKSALKTQMYTDAKFDALYGKLNCYDQQNDKQYYKLDNKIDALICETPKRAPFYACGTTPDVHNIDCHDFPRRRGCHNDCDCGCGCN